MSEAYGPTSCTFGLAPESKLSRSPKAQYGFVPKLSHHDGKTIKKLSVRSWFFSDAIAERCFSFDDVFSCAATSDDVRVCARACSQAQNHEISTKARRAKDISRGVLYVFVNNRNLNKYDTDYQGRW